MDYHRQSFLHQILHLHNTLRKQHDCCAHLLGYFCLVSILQYFSSILPRLKLPWMPLVRLWQEQVDCVEKGTQCCPRQHLDDVEKRASVLTDMNAHTGYQQTGYHMAFVSV